MSTEHTLTQPTAEQARKWEDTRAALVWGCPAFSSVFYSMMADKSDAHFVKFSTDVPYAATDGKHIMVNPDTFFEFDLQERVFVIAHEIAHGIFDHMGMMYRLRSAGKVVYQDGKELPYDHATMNKAMDYVINDMLVTSNVGRMPKVGCHDTHKGTSMDSVIDVYRRIYDPNNNGGGEGFDSHLDPGATTGQDPTAAQQQRNPTEWATAIAAAANAAKTQGKLPAAIERLLNETLEPKVSWGEHILNFFNRRPGSGTYDWTKPDRRLVIRGIIAPGRSGFGCGPVVVAVDTSGSITNDIVQRFFAEIGGILEDVRPSELHIIWCDAKVNRVDECHSAGDLYDVRRLGAPGGGGTAFEPVFDCIRERGIEPDALLYLTDGYGSFPKEAPPYAVLWGSISPAGSVKYPFGTVVDVPV